MTKKELAQKVEEILTANEVPAEVVEEIIALVGPKAGGKKVDLAEITRVDEEGNLTHIKCSVFGCFIPVYDEEGNPNFYEKPDTELGWSRFSRAGEKARKDADKKYKATKEAVLKDLIEGNIDQDQAKALLEQAEFERKNLVAPEGLCAE